MRAVTNQGSNIHPVMVAEHDRALAPQDMDVDDIRHDTRLGIELDQVDRWVKTANQHPIVLGSFTSQRDRFLIEVARIDREIPFITRSEDELAVLAERLVSELPGQRGWACVSGFAHTRTTDKIYYVKYKIGSILEDPSID
jgi:hypothetical protein